MSIANSFRYLPKEREGKFLLDVGTGAGFPGVILHIMGRKNVLLCDKSSKKVLFLDYDGTLVKFNNDPELAVPNKNLLKLLK